MAVARPRRTSINRKVEVGISLVALVALAGALAPLLATHSPTAQDVTDRLASPSGQHWLGTDHLGRDVFARLLYAARVDVPLALAGALLPAVLGISVGALAGYVGRFVDTSVMRAADFVQAFPVYVFLIAVVFVVGPGAKAYLVAAGAIAWVTYARIVRAEVLRIRDLDFARAARIAGLGHRRVLLRHVLPNAVPQAVVYFASDVVLALVSLASLSFLGLGIQPPTAEWGSMIAEGQRFIRDQWWLSVTPGLLIVTVGLGFLLISEGIADVIGKGE
jgi:peptide/nickel transport system permease protein